MTYPNCELQGLSGVEERLRHSSSESVLPTSLQPRPPSQESSQLGLPPYFLVAPSPTFPGVPPRLVQVGVDVNEAGTDDGVLQVEDMVPDDGRRDDGGYGSPNFNADDLAAAHMDFR